MPQQWGVFKAISPGTHDAADAVVSPIHHYEPIFSVHWKNHPSGRSGKQHKALIARTMQNGILLAATQW
jgi:hypothetical protein